MSSATRLVSTSRPAPAAAAIADVVVVLALAAVAFAIEHYAAAYLPWGDEARGVVAVLVAAITALALTRRRGGTLAELGLRRPARLWPVPFQAVGIVVVFIAAQNIAPLLVDPFFELPEPDFSRYDAIRGNLPAALAMGLALPLAAAVPEEIVYRGFLMNRFATLFGTGVSGTASSVVLQALVFGAIHFPWGVGGVIVATIMGIVWGVAFVLCGRNLWVVIIAYSLAHVALVAQPYSASPP